MSYNNSIGSFVQDIFGKSKSQKQTEALTALAEKPVEISPLIFIIPAAALVISGIIYFAVLNKK